MAHPHLTLIPAVKYGGGASLFGAALLPQSLDTCYFLFGAESAPIGCL